MIANAVTIAHEENPSQIKYDQAVMRSHLVKCLSAKKVEPYLVTNPTNYVISLSNLCVHYSHKIIIMSLIDTLDSK